MKEYSTLLLVADALEGENFDFFREQNLMKLQLKLQREFFDFCTRAYDEFALLVDKDGFCRCLQDESRFFSALVVVAEKMPVLLHNKHLQLFLIYMFREPGVYFRGMVAVMQACGIEDTIAEKAHRHIGEPEVRNWCKANLGLCNADKLFAALKKEMPVPDEELITLCRPHRDLWLYCLVFFIFGLFGGVALLGVLLL